MVYHNKNKAFTLAEVLITLGVIGVVAALTLPSFVTKIQNKGYVEHLNKNYSMLQTITNKIIEEEGAPQNWILNAYSIGSYEPNERVVDMYAKKMNVAIKCERKDLNLEKETPCVLKNQEYYSLDGVSNPDLIVDGRGLYSYTYPLLLADGSSIALLFMSNPNGGYLWGFPDLTFIVDVNGKKKPNKVGRDIFLLYIDKKAGGKISPFLKEKLSGSTPERLIDDCKDGGKGFSCAYKVISEGKMNY